MARPARGERPERHPSNLIWVIPAEENGAWCQAIPGVGWPFCFGVAAWRPWRPPEAGKPWRFDWVGSMQVTINGKAREVGEGLSIAGLLLELGLDTRFAAVALNGEVVRRADHPAVMVKEGDRIEIVHAVSGGA